MTAPGVRPFEGVKVLDFTQVFAGPFGSYQLALFGADVVKVEKPGGEDLRFSPPAPEWAERGAAPMWACVNANKRNLALDLKNPDAIRIVRRLAEQADVVMENFRPGVMTRLGIGYEALREINPRLIYCAVSGFGHAGPESGTAAYDGKIQAMSGIMSLTGEPEGAPMKAGVGIADVMCGMYAAVGILAALRHRDRASASRSRCWTGSDRWSKHAPHTPSVSGKPSSSTAASDSRRSATPATVPHVTSASSHTLRSESSRGARIDCRHASSPAETCPFACRHAPRYSVCRRTWAPVPPSSTPFGKVVPQCVRRCSARVASRVAWRANARAAMVQTAR